MHNFIPGLKLSELFFKEAVKPALENNFPVLKYAAVLIGYGSEILGFDDKMSRDHHWGPRLMLFLKETDYYKLKNKIDYIMRLQLPREFYGYPTNFSEPDPEDGGTQLLQAIDGGEVNHRVEIFTPGQYFKAYLNFDIKNIIKPADWLSFPQHKLRSIIKGRVYFDQIGLQKIRKRFTCYPKDIWLYLLASGWHRLAQEEHLMGRAGLVGDKNGAAIIASRMVRDIMNLCFLMEKRYAPYPKWFGTAFKKLKCAGNMSPLLDKVLSVSNWREKEKYLSMAYELLVKKQNSLKICECLSPKVSLFFNRPFKVIQADRFAKAIVANIKDKEVKRIAGKGLIGGIDQISDNTDILSHAKWRQRFKKLYD
jgi:hypothetical protein